MNPFIINKLNILNTRRKIERFIFDEAHCISTWGREFRASYRDVSKVISIYKEVPIVCSTATATEEVIKDISKLLKIENFDIFKTSFNRPNLYLEILPKNRNMVVLEVKEPKPKT